MSESLADRLARVRQTVAEAALRSGRRPEDVLIIGVTKTVPLVLIEEAWAAGLQHFGENRVQEAEEKITAWRAAHPERQATWHLIGHLQTNKARAAVSLFDTIQSIDSLRVAEAVSRRAVQAGRTVPVLLEVNVGGEPTKYGFHPDAVIAAAGQVARLPGLRIVGLMTVAPLVADPEAVRPVFRRLRELRDTLQIHYPSIPWQHLSMGMTNDYVVAIEEGATMVRLGRAIFGERPA